MIRDPSRNYATILLEMHQACQELAHWRHQWGHSRLGRLRKHMQAKLVEEYAPESDMQKELVRDAAELLAIAVRWAWKALG